MRTDHWPASAPRTGMVLDNSSQRPCSRRGKLSRWPVLAQDNNINVLAGGLGPRGATSNTHDLPLSYNGITNAAQPVHQGGPCLRPSYNFLNGPDSRHMRRQYLRHSLVGPSHSAPDRVTLPSRCSCGG